MDDTKQICTLREYPIIEESFISQYIFCDIKVAQCVSCKEYICHHHAIPILGIDDFKMCCKCINLNEIVLLSWNGKSHEFPVQTIVLRSEEYIKKLIQIYGPLTKPCK